MASECMASECIVFLASTSNPLRQRPLPFRFAQPGDVMKAVVAPKVNAPVVIEDRPIPQPKAGEVLIKVHACGVCRSDLGVILGEMGFATFPSRTRPRGCRCRRQGRRRRDLAQGRRSRWNAVAVLRRRL